MTIEQILPARRAEPRTGSLLAYGLLGLPLATAALPIYVQVPKLYAGSFGVPLAVVGSVLLVSRLTDALTDPLIGWASDRVPRRRMLCLAGLPLLALGLWLVLRPPDGAGAAWLFGGLLVATLGYSVATINYQAWGAELVDSADGRQRAAAAREGFGLVGVVLAAALPAWLGADLREGLAATAWAFAPLAMLCAALCIGFAPAPPVLAPASHPPWLGWHAALSDPAMRRLLVLFAVGGIAAAVPSATVLFYISDVLQAEQATGGLLAIYFVSGAAGMPIWVRAARRWGKPRAWAAAMAVTLVVFAWAGLLSAGQVWAFGLICALSGLALGADLAIPPAMLADLLARRRHETSGATWFGLWNLINKANLAIAAGLALPILALCGYRPGSGDADAARVLALVYAALPVTLKLVALALLWRWQSCFEDGRA